MWSSHKLWLGRISLIIPFSLDRVLRTLCSWTGFCGDWICLGTPLLLPLTATGNPASHQQSSYILTTSQTLSHKCLICYQTVSHKCLICYQTVSHKLSDLLSDVQADSALGSLGLSIRPKVSGKPDWISFSLLHSSTSSKSLRQSFQSSRVSGSHSNSFGVCYSSLHWFITFWKFSLYKVHYNLKATFGQLHQ